MNPQESLDLAHRIGSRLARRAIWDGSACTWEILTADRSAMGAANSERAGCLLYQGTAGIAWFLAELAHVTEDADIARAAAGGLRHASEHGAGLPPVSFGFHNGRIGIAWALARSAAPLERPEYLDQAWSLIEPLQGNEARDNGLDVIAGAAGAVPALLVLAELLDKQEPADMALRLGEHLLRTAHSEPDGWSWPMMTNTVARHLNGLAHGAAGAGLAMIELARRTGEARFRFAAEMAFLYERHSYNPRASNWPDWRNMEFGNLVFYSRSHEELLRGVRAGVPPYRPSYMAAWCHGSPGIGLTRLRALEITGQDLYRRETEAAVISTLKSIDATQFETENYSLCHGIAGNCELPFRAALKWDRPEWREAVDRAAQHGAEVYEKAGEPWPCGTPGGGADPSLLLGEAGIGLFYLRLARPETPTPLILEPRHDHSEIAFSAAEFSASAKASADEFFGVGRRAVEHLTGASLNWEPPNGEGPPLDETPAEAVHVVLLRRLEAAEGELGALLSDACRMDFERWHATHAITEYSAEYVRNLTRSEWDDLDPRKATFHRAPDSRLVFTHRDWSSFQPESGALPEEEDVHLLLYRRSNRIHSQRIGVFAALLLDALARPLSLDLLLDRASEAFGDQVDRELLEAKVLPQVAELYRAGFIVSVEASPSPIHGPSGPPKSEQFSSR